MAGSASRTEDAILERIDRQRAPRPVREACPQRTALEMAFTAYAVKYGRPEARLWASARAHFTPSAKPVNRLVFKVFGGDG